MASSKATEQQKLAVFKYNQMELERQRKLFDQGVTSRDALDQADQAYKNSKADYESAVATTLSQKKQLGYYHIAAPFDGIVGDVPVHLGDYVSSTTLLTTVDENRDLEAYIYIPTERVTQMRKGLPVEILDNSGKLLERTAIDFLSPQVQDQLQGILAKAPVHADLARCATKQQVMARVIWKTAPKPVVPVLAVTRLGGQTFVYVATEPGRQILCAAAAYHARGHRRQQLSGDQGIAERRQGYRFGNAVPGGWRAGAAAWAKSMPLGGGDRSLWPDHDRSLDSSRALLDKQKRRISRNSGMGRERERSRG